MPFLLPIDQTTIEQEGVVAPFLLTTHLQNLTGCCLLHAAHLSSYETVAKTPRTIQAARFHGQMYKVTLKVLSGEADIEDKVFER